MLSRPPVVTVLGHVDHGKTSLLDRLRQANVAARELGGITQAIGAYQVDHHGQIITFIDTPGHAAFSAMRERGGQVADIAILVVAADDGVMPQTKESIQHIKSANIPYVVAANKTDLPQANVLKIKSDLAELGEYVEGYGGNVPLVEISAKTGQGLDSLLETVLLLAELKELQDTSRDPFSAIIIESQLHPHKGPLATLLVKAGQLALKADLYSGQQKIGRVRSLIDYTGVQLKFAPPSTPVQILGFDSLPAVGDIITNEPREVSLLKTASPSSVTILGATTSSVDKLARPNIIIKADVAGSLEAILSSLPSGVVVLHSSVGAVTESDVQLAATNAATIICFNVKAGGSVAKLAQVEAVKIVVFGIIYELFDYLTDLVGDSQKAAVPQIVGEAKVIKTFPFNNQIVYGCLITSGKIKLGDRVGDSRVVSLHLGKETVGQAKKDQECGLILEPHLDYQPGDVIIVQQNN